MGEVDIDVIKIDTQGLELPILKKSGKCLKKAFYVETETGFFENYHGETTYAMIDEFMRSKGYLLFDINTDHRVSRNNILSGNYNGEQIMWCEATWMKDYISLYKKGKINKGEIDREKALKCLILCAFQGCTSYGYELASLFKRLKLISGKELSRLRIARNWSIAVPGKTGRCSNGRKVDPAIFGAIARRIKQQKRRQ